jgi:nitrite reductase/ring-hydroxylating ferredoxin subunit
VSAVDLCAFDELTEGRVHDVAVDRLRLGALRVGEDVYVFPGVCPHRAGPLDHGKLEYPVVAEQPGAIEVAHDVPAVTCPWHGWQFRLDNGCAIGAEDTRINLLDARVVDGRVVVDLPGH